MHNIIINSVDSRCLLCTFSKYKIKPNLKIKIKIILFINVAIKIVFFIINFLLFKFLLVEDPFPIVNFIANLLMNIEYPHSFYYNLFSCWQ